MEKYLSKFENLTAALSNQKELTSPHVSLLEAEEEVVYSGSETYGSKIKFEKDETTGKLYFVVNGPSYEMVDLGLSVKWANMNVGATSPEENGLYFSWGNVEGHTVDENNNVIDYSFDEDTYASTVGSQFTGSTLDAKHDAATVNMGDGWRMPTSANTKELVNNTTQTVEELNGVNGMRFTSKTNGNSIFIPFAGYCNGGLLYGCGTYGGVWSSSLLEGDSSSSRYLHFSSVGIVYGDGSDGRYFGQSVRGVHA